MASLHEPVCTTYLNRLLVQSEDILVVIELVWDATEKMPVQCLVDQRKQKSGQGEMKTMPLEQRDMSSRLCCYKTGKTTMKCNQQRPINIT